ncbi:RNA polymerase sigma factor [Sphaerisporangium rufum]|uniref:RNA polymerase sigma factor n=1 Tax=Sphaerisporangium rufum TaxID=1381558 RepID=UPI00194FDC86|nr:sigma-70 family RNA polymerase sigma factor [Sphaerisporangium rufum]
MADALRRADDRAVDLLYDAYADRLNDYACSLLHDTDAAADAVHDAMVLAHGRAEVLREPARLRAWLYALTRSRCAPSRGAGDRPPEEYDDDADDPELTAVIREALAELADRDREALLLAVRHGLTPADLGAVLGLSSRQAGGRVARARDHLEIAAAAVVLARTGRAHCPDLSALLDSIEGPLPQPLRRRLVRHISGCRECADGRRRRVSADGLLAGVPVAFPPLSLRRRVATTCGAAGQAAERAAIAASGVFDRDGFPVPARRARAAAARAGAGARASSPAASPAASRASSRGRAGAPAGAPATTVTFVGAHAGDRRPGRHGAGAGRRAARRATPVLAAAACVLVATGTMLVATGQDLGSHGPQALRFPSRTPGELQIRYGPAPTGDTGPTSAVTASTPAPARTSPTGAPAAAAPTGGALAAPSRTPSRRPPGPTGSASPPARLVVSCPPDIGEEEDTAVILVSARHGTVSWTATATGGLAVVPARGVLAPDARARLVVTAPDTGAAGGGVVTLRSGATGGSACRVSWPARQPPVSEPPTDEPENPQNPDNPSQSATPAPSEHSNNE